MGEGKGEEKREDEGRDEGERRTKGRGEYKVSKVFIADVLALKQRM